MGEHCRESRAQLWAQNRLIEAQIGTSVNIWAERSSSQGSGNSAASIEAEIAHQIAQLGLKNSFLSQINMMTVTNARRVTDATKLRQSYSVTASWISLSVATSLLN